MKATKSKIPDAVSHSPGEAPLRRRFRGFSVRGKISLAFLLFTLLAMGLLWVFQFVFLNQIYRAIKLGHLERGADAIIQKVGQEDLYSSAEEVSRRYDFSVLLVYPETGSMTSLASNSQNRPLTLENCLELIRLAEEAGGSHLQSARYEEAHQSPSLRDPDAPSLPLYDSSRSDAEREDEEQHVIYTALFEAEEGVTAALLIQTTITPISAARETLFYVLVAVSVILVVLALALAAFMSRTVARPIVEISKGALRLAEGDYSHRFAETGSYREAGELAATLNHTSAELAKVEDLRRELIANISHDLRTPLTLISGYSEVMRDLPGEITPENLQTIIDESARLTSLVNDMLEISRIQSGNLTPNPLPFSFSDMLRESVATYQTLATCKGYHFTLLIPEEVTVEGDRAMLVRALNNLINNALTYTGTDRLVQIRQVVTPGRVRVEVTDTGEGIPQEKLHDIWDRYYKVDSQHKRSAVGTGLGLSIVKSIISLHGGSWGVRSSNGYGSTFWFELQRTEV